MIYSHFVVFKKSAYGFIGVKTTKWLYLSHLTSYQENKGTLFSSTFNVEENKVPLFSWFEVKWLRCSHFVVFKNIAYGFIGVKTTKSLYLSHLTSYQENKDTLFSSTFKVGENKVPLFSWFEVNDWDIAILLFLRTSAMDL